MKSSKSKETYLLEKNLKDFDAITINGLMGLALTNLMLIRSATLIWRMVSGNKVGGCM